MSLTYINNSKQISGKKETARTDPEMVLERFKYNTEQYHCNRFN